MPIYEYEPETQESCEACEGGFEALQKPDEEALDACPECGAPCRRVLSAFGIVTSTRALLSKRNLEEKGFHMYKKSGDGVYEKAAGKGGPQIIKK